MATKNYPHFMLAEIFEQPEARPWTLARYLEGDRFREEVAGPLRAWLAAQRQLLIAASGSSRHAGLYAETRIEDLSTLPVDVEYASEYGYRRPRARLEGGVLVISQSGETADTLAALRKGAEEGRPTLAVTNAADSTMAREATLSMPTAAGVERAIPATKSFTTQLVVMELLALLAAEAHGGIPEPELRAALAALGSLPELIEGQLEVWRQQMAEAARALAGAQSMLFLGRGLHFPIAREGALKLKESAYLHAEAYPSGELKHGPNALVSEGIPLCMLATAALSEPASVLRRAKVAQLMAELREQGAIVLAIANRGDDEVRRIAAHTVEVDPAPEALLAIAETVPLQLFAYYAALERGIDVDRPRNLVKAVTAE